MMRWFAGTAFLTATLLAAGTATASVSYPDAIKTHLGLDAAPPSGCLLCHSGASGGFNTATTPFGATAHGPKYKLHFGDTAQLATVLDAMESANPPPDSDGDGVSDIEELRNGTDPNANAPDGGVVLSPSTQPSLEHGCAATLAPTAPAPSSGAALGLALVATLAWARRRRGSPRRARQGVVVVAAIAGSLGLVVGCYDTALVSKDVCPGGVQWTGGDVGSPEMHPGRACITCHAVNDAPKFKIAGTVYPGREPDDCAGLSDAEVVITGADGTSITLTANAAGNFYSERSVAMPYKATVAIHGGAPKAMVSPQTNGDCNSCHTEKGANGAPNRITIP